MLRYTGCRRPFVCGFLLWSHIICGLLMSRSHQVSTWGWRRTSSAGWGVVGLCDGHYMGICGIDTTAKTGEGPPGTSAITSSGGNDMSVSMVVANGMHMAHVMLG